MSAEAMQIAREWLEECVRVATRNGVTEEADLEAAVLAHIDGEAARTAAAVAAALTDQRAVFSSREAEWKAEDERCGAEIRIKENRIIALEAERDALRAQVEAVRALCARFERGGGTLWPGEVLAAMDGAKS